MDFLHCMYLIFFITILKYEAFLKHLFIWHLMVHDNFRRYNQCTRVTSDLKAVYFQISLTKKYYIRILLTYILFRLEIFLVVCKLITILFVTKSHAIWTWSMYGTFGFFCKIIFKPRYIQEYHAKAEIAA